MSEERNVGNLKAELARLRTAEVEEINWDAVDGYSKDDRAQWMKKYDSTLMDLTERRIVKGKVISVDDREVIVNIGFKSEGIIPISEFRDKNAVKVGDEIEVYLETVENKSGQMIVSRRLANSMRTWERINSALDEDIIMEGIVKRRTKGGFVVDLEGIEAFLPGSQIDVKPIRDYDFYVGQRMEFKVVKINHVQNNVVISHKALIEKDLEAQKTEIINNLEKGQILEGVVKNITTFGVFIDLGGVDGLLHITDISWGRVNDPHEVLHLDQKINVVVLDFDDEKKRISLGLKQLLPHPWENLGEGIGEGKIVKGKVVTITDYGIFIEVMPGVEGLIHISEMSWSAHLKSPQELFNVGDEVEAMIIQLSPEERKMSLGIKQLSKDPWEESAEKYAVGSRHTGIVRNITNFGLFVELEEGIDGLIHIQDLSWSRKINHPSEFIQKDEKLEVLVLELDKEGRKLRLGHKQLTEDPWETLESVFPVDSIHTPVITKMNDAGAVVELEYGIEGFIPGKLLKTKEGEPDFKEGDAVPSVVIEFNKDSKRIVLSHVKTWQTKDKKEEVVVHENTVGGQTLGENSDLAKLASATVAETPVAEVEPVAVEAVSAVESVVENTATETTEN